MTDSTDGTFIPTESNCYVNYYVNFLNGLEDP